MPVIDGGRSYSKVGQDQIVTPAKAGVQKSRVQRDSKIWIPAFAGMTAHSFCLRILLGAAG